MSTFLINFNIFYFQLRVNFTKYPGLREVEYHRAEMEEGDCLFIPYLW